MIVCTIVSDSAQNERVFCFLHVFRAALYIQVPSVVLVSQRANCSL